MFNFIGILSIKKNEEIIYKKKNIHELNVEKTCCDKSVYDKVNSIQEINKN